MNVTPLPVVHIHVPVPVWACIVALLILAAALAWDVLGTQVVRDQVEQAADDADNAIRKAEAIENHLTGLEPASTGRHASSEPAAYRPRPHPRSAP